jgi:hypothetical protein
VSEEAAAVAGKRSDAPRAAVITAVAIRTTTRRLAMSSPRG